MSSPADEIARRLAERLAPEVGPTLPARVERAIVLDNAADPDPPPDPALVLALAPFLVNLAKATWGVYRDLTKPTNEPMTPGEVALLRGMLADGARQSGRHVTEIPNSVRTAAVEAAIEETVEAAKRYEQSRS